MKSLMRRRPSPALVISLLALFLSLGGVSYGVATGFIDSREIRNNEVRTRDLRNNDIRTRDLRNNEVRGRDIRNSTIQGRDLAINSVSGEDVNESDLDQVPSAANADSLGGRPAAQYLDRATALPFSVKLSAGQSVELARNGSVSVVAECTTNGNDTIRLLAASAASGAVMDGVTPHDGAATGTFGPGTPESSRVLAQLSSPAPNDRLVQSQDPTDPANVGGFVLGPDARGLHLIASDSSALGLNFATAKCLAAGLLLSTG